MDDEHSERRGPQNTGNAMEEDVPRVQPDHGSVPSLSFPELPAFQFEPVPRVQYYGVHDSEAHRRNIRRRVAQEGAPDQEFIISPCLEAQRQSRLAGTAPAEPEAMPGIELQCPEVLPNSGHGGGGQGGMPGAAEAQERGPRGQTSGEAPRITELELTERSASEPVGGGERREEGATVPEAQRWTGNGRPPRPPA